MTKQQLMEAISADVQQKRSEVEEVVESLLEIISETLERDERVDIRGFGSFVAKQKKARLGRNPRTGASLEIPAKRDASFKPSKELTQRLMQSRTVAAES